MTNRNNMFGAVDMLLKAKINNEILENCPDPKSKQLIKLLNEYGIWGVDVAAFIQKLVLILGGDTQ